MPFQPNPILSTSSSTNTGLLVSALIISLIKTPGYESTKVLKWPLKKEVSSTPDKETTLHSLCNASAISFAIVVFPVPGGPVKRIDNPLDPLEVLLSLIFD